MKSACLIDESCVQEKKENTEVLLFLVPILHNKMAIEAQRVHEQICTIMNIEM